MASNTSDSNPREHAKHNKKVYNHLRQNLEYIDWVITTAFYTALHFVEYQVFPLTIEIAGKKKTFESVNEYKPYSGKRSKHAARIKAVKKELPGCKRPYKELFDLSFLARYHQYQFDNPKKLDKKVNGWLSKIVKECDQ